MNERTNEMKIEKKINKQTINEQKKKPYKHTLFVAVSSTCFGYKVLYRLVSMFMMCVRIFLSAF